MKDLRFGYDQRRAQWPLDASAFATCPLAQPAGRARQRLGDEGLLSHPQCNSGIDYL
jgi:hypothetical protein